MSIAATSVEPASKRTPRGDAEPAAAPPEPTPPSEASHARGASQGVWVFGDQAVVSLANFAAPVLVGRYGGQQELGLFVLGFSIYLFTLSLARAAIWTAYTSRAPRANPEERQTLAGSATAHVAGYVAAVGVALLLAAFVAWGAGAAWLTTLLLLLIPCSAAMLLREHVRRLCLTRLASREVFAFDIVVGALQIGLLVGLAAAGRMTAATAFLSLGGAALVSLVWLAWRHDWLRVRPRAIVDDWRASWGVSKWLAAGATSVQLGNQGYRWLLPIVASVAELGRFGAAQLVGQVTNPLVIGVSNYLGPATAHVLGAEGKRGLWRYTVRVSLVMLAAAVGFLTCVGLVGLPLVEAVFGEAADGVTPLLLLTFAAGVSSEALLIPVEFSLVNLDRTRLMFQTALLRLGVNASLGFALVSRFGAEAIGVGTLLGCSVALAWQWSAFRAEVRRA